MSESDTAYEESYLRGQAARRLEALNLPPIQEPAAGRGFYVPQLRKNPDVDPYLAVSALALAQMIIVNAFAKTRERDRIVGVLCRLIEDVRNPTEFQYPS